MPIFTALTQYSDLGILALRIAVGIIFLYHSVPKLKNPAMMAGGIGWHPLAVMLLGTAELAGGISVILGIYAQIGALILGLVMLGALYYKILRWHTPFFAMDKSGWEFDLVLLAANIAILFIGGGRFVLV
ncbi:TPA: hypothetical protein DCZ32_04855 [Candidatus Uhrbacteria bacterium]|nr:hypothetical protein [Candidatus Uhrbacteria bacterium]